ncbi:MAG TPA: 6-phosphofructokinase [Candidatus Coatesbacteria bacterium]|nr:6-phosphofructokinase [Candidatus Coatesbacteria bacterium]
MGEEPRIAVLTSGGDSPGMNACIRSVTRCALSRGWRVWGVRDGYRGLVEGRFADLESRDVGGIIDRGGTILGTSRFPEFLRAEARGRAYDRLGEKGVGGLVAIGGNGTAAGALDVSRETKLAVVCVPASIDNDVYGTDNSIGFDTAVNTALGAVDKLRQTADSHHRIFFVEVMGRKSGAIALEVALAGGAEAAVVPEIPASAELTSLAERLKLNLKRSRKKSALVICAEGAARAEDTAREVESLTGIECRATVLGHLQRGGAPTSYDRNLAARLGWAAVEAVARGKSGVIVGLVSNDIRRTSLEEVAAREHHLNRRGYDLLETLSL